MTRVPESPARRAIAEFRRRFGIRPRVVASAPGRINIVGEHVDYAGGVVLPLPIAERTAVALGWSDPGGERPSEIVSMELDRAATARAPARFEPLRLEDADAWLNAAVGPIRALVDRGVPVPAVRAVVASDVPIGAGLSSSAALSTAIAAAVLRAVGAEMDGTALALLLQDAERRFVGTPCGVMDMMTAIAGRSGAALRLDCRTLDIESVPIPPGLAMFVVDSGVRHALAKSAYGRRRAEVEQAAALLGMEHLRDATIGQETHAALPEVLRRRVRHVRREIERVDRAVDAMRRGDVVALGRIVSESHASLRDDFEVSVPAVDRVVALAEGADPGVLGARMVGGGFGGGVLVIVDAARAEVVERALRALGLGAAPHAIRVIRAGTGYTADAVEESTA